MKTSTLKWLGTFFCLAATPAGAASVVASVGGVPITDADVTARTTLMTRMGDTSTDNRRVALQNIIDDQIKLSYAANFKALPDDKDVTKELAAMKLGDLTPTQRAMAESAVRANIAWQIVVARTILPTIDISDDDIATERRAIAAQHGLPIEMTIVRLTDIPETVAAKLTRPASCDAAIKMAEDLGGAPQKFTAVQYELSADIRDRVADLAMLTWSPRVNDSVLLVCATKKTKEYGDLDKIIRQNAQFKKAMFMADQQLKQLRRRAVIVINDDRYKL
ncbi:hypothetical protein HDR63_00875 [bacterium]|nr:hypothetical protein [bacterium]